MIYDELHNKPSVFIQSGPRHRQNVFSFLRERQNTVHCSFCGSGRRSVARGPFHNFSLAFSRAWGCGMMCCQCLMTLIKQKKCLSSLRWGDVSIDRHIVKKSELREGDMGELLSSRCGLFFKEIEIEKSLNPLFHNHSISFHLLTHSTLLFLSFCQQGRQISSNRGAASHLSRRWLTPASQTPGCITPEPSLTPPTPPAAGSAASACQPLLDTTPTCRHPTRTTRPKTSSPIPTCITAQALDPTSSPWWRRGTPEGSAPPPACCPARGPVAPE